MRWIHRYSKPATVGKAGVSTEIDDFAEELDGLVIPPTDEPPEYFSRPDNAGATWLELYGMERGLEQRDRFVAAGEAAGQRHREEKAEHEPSAEQETILIDAHQPVVATAWELYKAMLVAFVGLGLVRRSKRERRYYLGRMAFLLLGDLVGISGGLIILGEIPWLAVLQSLAGAVAAVTSGLLGSEIKDARLARKRERDPGSLTAEQQRFAMVFAGPDRGEYIVKLMIYAALSVVLLVGVGIFMLRTTTEGAAAGVVFGAIAMAVAVGSWINTYHYTDDLADLLETAHETAEQATADHKRLTAQPARAIVAREAASIESLQKQHDLLGRAAEHRVQAMIYAKLVGQPAIVGYGLLATSQTPPSAGGAQADDAGGATGPESRFAPSGPDTPPMAHANGVRHEPEDVS